MQIRKATHKDAKKISYLIRKNTDQVKENLYTPDQIKVWKNQNTPLKIITDTLNARTTFVGFQNNKLVGTIGIKGNNLLGFYFSYSKRGKGLGGDLLLFVAAYAKKINLTELHLTATPSGYGFYLKYGYLPYGKIDLYYDGVKFVETKMKKVLK